MEPELRQEIETLVSAHKVVLFMKGTRSFPQCGFSATVVNLLRDAGAREIKDVNILARADMREAMKEFTNWPTFPQVYIDGQFIGGCDILRELHASGELHEALGTPKPEVKVPSITISDAAAKAITDARDGEPGTLRIEISADFQYALSIDEQKPSDLVAKAGDITVLFDRESAIRAEGLRIDFLSEGQGGFKLENPNEPPRVQVVSVTQLKALLDQGKVPYLFDVRTDDERARAKLAASKHYDESAQLLLKDLPRDTPVYFMCHHGGRSQQAAEHYLRQGFTQVYNVAGGIEAWSLQVDPSVPRY
jgi:monothiol glutaredoxin